MKKKLLNSLRVLLVAAGLGVGANNAWADDEYSAVYTKTLTGETAWATSDLTEWGVSDNDKFSVNETNGLTLSVNGYSYNASYSVNSIAATSKIKYVVEWNVGNLVANNTSNTTNNTYLMFGDKLRLSFDRAYKVYWSTDGTFVRDDDHRASGNNANNKTVTVTLIYDPKKRTVESFTTSGINSYANDLTTAVNREFSKEDIDMRKVTFGYYRTGNNTEITTSIKSISVSECTQDAPTGHRYTINAVDDSGNFIKSLKSDYAENGAPVSVSNLNLVLYKGGKFYELDDAAVSSYGKSFTMVDEDATFEVTYKESSNIVYFKEAEAFDGSNGASANSGASGGAYTSYFKNNTTNSVAKFNKGVYRAETYIWARDNQYINLYNTTKEDANILAGLTGSGAQSKIFAIDTDGTSTILGCAYNSCCFDYLLIRKVGDVLFTLGADAGDSYKSYVTTGNTDFATLGVTAYIAKAADTANGTVTLSTIDTAPANIPVLLKGTKGEYATITTTSTTYSAPASNLLKAADGETAIGSSDAKYVLAYNSGWEFRHYNGTLSAGKVYLDLSELGGAAASLNFIFEDETNGIKTVQSEGNAANTYYNLSGQRVNQPAKGLYIVNGRKVIIK